MQLPVYMDHHATTPTDPRVVEAMLPYFTTHFGNAASRQHAFGWDAEKATEQARDRIAAAIGADGKEIVLTSGATESNNLALKGVARFYAERGKHIVTLVTEHKAVIDPCKTLADEGLEVTLVPVGSDGLVDPDDVKAALRDDTILVSVMAANNEIGVLQPIEAIGALCRERNILFHTDAAQALGKIPLDVGAIGADLMSLSAHKCYGPKGVGALYVRRKPRVRLTPILDGGGHERGMRSGTLNTPGAVGFGVACEIATDEIPAESARLLELREHLRKGLLEAGGVRVNGSLERRLPGNLNVSFEGVDGDALLRAIKDVAVSSGSACTSATLEPSYVLRALGLDDELAHASLRFGLGRANTREEVDFVVELIVRKVNDLRRR